MITWPSNLSVLVGAGISAALAAGITYAIVLVIRVLKRWGR